MKVWHPDDNGTPERLYHYSPNNITDAVMSAEQLNPHEGGFSQSFWTTVETRDRHKASLATGLSPEEMDWRLEWVLTDQDKVDYAGDLEMRAFRWQTNSHEYSIFSPVPADKLHKTKMP